MITPEQLRGKSLEEICEMVEGRKEQFQIMYFNGTWYCTFDYFNVPEVGAVNIHDAVLLAAIEFEKDQK